FSIFSGPPPSFAFARRACRSSTSARSPPPAALSPPVVTSSAIRPSDPARRTSKRPRPATRSGTFAGCRRGARSLSPASRSSALPLRFALLEERGHALDRVLGLELDRQLRAQERERVGERHVHLAPDRVLAEPHDQRR